jgi:hypothetical protein
MASPDSRPQIPGYLICVFQPRPLRVPLDFQRPHPLTIAECLAASEPDRADYQRDLSVSYNKVGDLYRDLRQADQARISVR